MVEERHRCQALPEGHLLCVNNCGSFESSVTMNLCSKCYKDLGLKDQSMSPSIPLNLPSPTSLSSDALPEVAKGKEVVPVVKVANMCASGKKCVGFRYRCGETFCGAHRYPEKRSCVFNFKKADWEEIDWAN